jgi:hypothetical protein
MSTFSASELEDIKTFNETLAATGVGNPDAVLVNLNFVRKCSDGVRRKDIHDYLDFLFPPSVDTYIESQTASFTDRVVTLKDTVTTHLEFVVTYPTATTTS